MSLSDHFERDLVERVHTLVVLRDRVAVHAVVPRLPLGTSPLRLRAQKRDHVGSFERAL